MRSDRIRYSADSLRALGLGEAVDLLDHGIIHITQEDVEKQRIFSYGNFESIIKVLFSDPDSRPGFDTLLSENSDPKVVSFVNNFLMKEIRTIPPMQSDEDAFASIIPKHIQTEGELRPYLDSLKQFISDNRPKSEASVEASVEGSAETSQTE